MTFIIISMIIWGSIGIFVRLLELPSVEIAFLRALIASFFLLSYSFIFKVVDIKRIKKNIILLVIAGIAVGLNWIMLFQSYRYTSIANATISYYFAPIIVLFLSPIILKEKMTLLKFFSILTSMTGLFVIMYYSADNMERASNNFLGILFGLFSAVLYALIILVTKKMKDISALEICLVEMIVATLVLLPFVIHNNQLHIKNIQTGIIILILGIVHTGLAYILYFTGIRKVKAQNAALLSYIDPLCAILFSMIILGEIPNKAQKIGALLIFSSSLITEIKNIKVPN